MVAVCWRLRRLLVLRLKRCSFSGIDLLFDFIHLRMFLSIAVVMSLVSIVVMSSEVSIEIVFRVNVIIILLVISVASGVVGAMLFTVYRCL